VIGICVKGEVRAAEVAVVAFSLVPDRHLRCDVLADKPAEELARAIGRFCRQPLRNDPEALTRALQYRRSNVGYSSLHACASSASNTAASTRPGFQPMMC
jgi:hypothetical protein